MAQKAIKQKIMVTIETGQSCPFIFAKLQDIYIYIYLVGLFRKTTRYVQRRFVFYHYDIRIYFFRFLAEYNLALLGREHTF